jgi:hypothetical protein
MTATSRPLSLSFVVVECSGEMLSDAIDIAAALRAVGTRSTSPRPLRSLIVSPRPGSR